ncbi:serine hydrolase domain-containing protein [Serinicoccus chungangensis]|nr:serine hydrolase domain-containing protein [Serinicoccus chungangensis]
MTTMPRLDDTALSAAAAEDGFSGLVSLDVPGHEPVTRAFGYAERAFQVPHSRSTRYALASGGKTFTALAVLRLVEQGRLRLDEPVRGVLGEDLPLVDDAVTPLHLLSHTSGIGDYLDESAGWEIDDYVLPVPVHTLVDAEAFLSVLDGYPQAFAPGERFAYCNGGYVVLALVVERRSGQGYQQFVEEEVCGRAGLRSTGFLRSDELPADAARGYLDATGLRTNVLHLPVLGNGDGGIVSTAPDLHRFWGALLQGRIVGPPLLELLTTPRYDVPDEGLRHAAGLWLHATAPLLVMEGCDAGVSFRSTHDPGTGSTLSVLGNTSTGAWPVIGELADLLVAAG